MFEMGKQYKRKWDFNLTFTCVYASVELVVLRHDDAPHREFALSQGEFEYYAEYKPPRAVEITRFVKELRGGELYLTDGVLETYGNTLGRIRISHTEGQGLAVEVLG